MMRDLLSDYAAEITEHREWLRKQPGNRLKKWNDQLGQSPESAICEAMVCAFLDTERIRVMPNEDPSSGGPDFLCHAGDDRFYVEVTCVTADKVTSSSSLSNQPQEACYYSSLTHVFRGELSGKVSQCSRLDYPCLVAVGTLHLQGGVLCFGQRAVEDLLTGTPKMTMKCNTALGETVGDPYETTSLADSAFVRFEKGSSSKVGFARTPISGVLLCAFGYANPCVFGALHPNPNHRFDRALLPSVRFAKLADKCLETGELAIEWI